MKKKVLTILFMFLILPCAFLLTACNTNVAGKSYEFECVKGEISSEISAEDLSALAVSLGLSASASKSDVQAKFDKSMEAFTNAMKGKENKVTFNTDGTMTAIENDAEKEYVWKQKGSLVTINETFEDGTVDEEKTQELKVVSAKRVSAVVDVLSGDGYTVRVYYMRVD